jgi:hypothetical protein
MDYDHPHRERAQRKLLLPAVLTLASALFVAFGAVSLFRILTVERGREVLPAKVIGYEERGLANQKQLMLRVSPILEGRPKGSLLLEGADIPKTLKEGDTVTLLFRKIRAANGGEYEEYLLNDFAGVRTTALWRILIGAAACASSARWWLKLRKATAGQPGGA